MAGHRTLSDDNQTNRKPSAIQDVREFTSF